MGVASFARNVLYINEKSIHTIYYELFMENYICRLRHQDKPLERFLRRWYALKEEENWNNGWCYIFTISCSSRLLHKTFSNSRVSCPFPVQVMVAMYKCKKKLFDFRNTCECSLMYLPDIIYNQKELTNYSMQELLKYSKISLIEFTHF